jgi:hypothetical protein
MAKGKKPKDTTKENKLLPKGFKRKRKIKEADAHLMVARTTATMGPPPFICVASGPPPAPCLRYNRDPKTGEYSIPPFGIPMDCAACRAGRTA